MTSDSIFVDISTSTVHTDGHEQSRPCEKVWEGGGRRSFDAHFASVFLFCFLIPGVDPGHKDPIPQGATSTLKTLGRGLVSGVTGVRLPGLLDRQWMALLYTFRDQRADSLSHCSMGEGH